MRNSGKVATAGLGALALVAAVAVGRDINAPTAAPLAAVATEAAPSRTESLYVEQLAGIALGRVGAAQQNQNTRLINAALAAGDVLRLRPGTRVEIGSTLFVPSGGGIIGDPGGAKPVIYMPGQQFTNRVNDVGRDRYGPSAVGINFSGSISGGQPTAGVRLENFHLQSDPSPGRYLRGIVGRNVQDCEIQGVEISGIPTGIGIALASARRCEIANVSIHDFADSTDWRTLPQSTAIEIDNDLVNARPSTELQIHDFRIANIVVSGPFFSHWGYQSDGINIVNAGAHVSIRDGRISNVGEGIDTFGSYGTIDNVAISETYNFGLKFIHGATGNKVNNVTITDAGLAGVTFAGSCCAHQDTRGNVLSNIFIKNIDPHGAWSSHDTAGVLIADNRGTAGLPRNNRIINARIELGPNGKYGWLDTSAGSDNEGCHLQIQGGRARAVLVLKHGGGVDLNGSSGCQ